MNGSLDIYPCCIPIRPGHEDSEYTCEHIRNDSVGRCMESDFCQRAANQPSPCIQGPLGRTCGDREGGCFDCPPFAQWDYIDCCFPLIEGVLYQIFPRIHRSVCSACGGWQTDAEHPCQPPTEEPTCEMAGADRPAPSGLRWTTDLLATVAFGIDEELDEDGCITPLTDHLCRPEPPTQTEIEPCVHSRGRFVMLEDANIYVETCSAPHRGRGVRSQRLSFCTLQTAEEGSDGFEEGAQYWVGEIHTPWWTEALLRSRTWLCGSVEE